MRTMDTDHDREDMLAALCFIAWSRVTYTSERDQRVNMNTVRQITSCDYCSPRV